MFRPKRHSYSHEPSAAAALQCWDGGTGLYLLSLFALAKIVNQFPAEKQLNGTILTSLAMCITCASGTSLYFLCVKPSGN